MGADTSHIYIYIKADVHVDASDEDVNVFVAEHLYAVTIGH